MPKIDTAENQLYRACNHPDGNILKAKLILRNNPTLNINWKHKPDGDDTVLHTACLLGRFDFVQLLLAHPDIDVNQKNRFGSTPFYVACSGSQVSIVRFMVQDPRVMINERDIHGYSALSRAALGGRLQAIKWIIASGKELDLGEEGDHSRAIKQARNNEMFSLLKRFEEDRAKTRFEIRMELGLIDPLVAELFLLVVLHCDGFLRTKNEAEENQQQLKAKRYLEIASRLPIELQMIACNCAFDSPKESVASKDFELAFQKHRSTLG